MHVHVGDEYNYLGQSLFSGLDHWTGLLDLPLTPETSSVCLFMQVPMSHLISTELVLRPWAQFLVASLGYFSLPAGILIFMG